MTNLEFKRKAAFAGFPSLEAQIELHYLVYELKKSHKIMFPINKFVSCYNGQLKLWNVHPFPHNFKRYIRIDS